MNTNEIDNKIGKWLFGDLYDPDSDIKIDFLRDRNQQKWIEDRLIELGYGIFEDCDITTKEWCIEIFDSAYPDSLYYASSKNKSKDLAFIQAVEQLIDKQ